eukprot:CAMPEP_0113692170 /NCGR_PEP_ID=MMETSP0038_2-20120614/18915_1 /TAXON_ID=2898 /ORGANISM="Cryptomonas paramecium" /LENGTH=68 /DNA_ID=CAMNT_0000614011 /DNA_START=786 /DNA_END=989 /DNA_ORIENTATION=- /assembly_acc=CAM_ASM_000170
MELIPRVGVPWGMDHPWSRTPEDDHPAPRKNPDTSARAENPPQNSWPEKSLARGIHPIGAIPPAANDK